MKGGVSKRQVGRLVIYGCGGHGREMVHAARDDSRPVVFLSDEPVPGYRDIPIISHADLQDDDEICLAVGSGEIRRRLAEKLRGFRFATIVAPTAVIDPTAEIGEGAEICDFCLVNSLVRIGCHFQCNSRSHVHHDSLIGDYVTFSPGTMCLGTVEIGNDVFVGAGAILRNGRADQPLRIGDGAIVGMGAVVTSDVPPGATMVGCPARRLVR